MKEKKVLTVEEFGNRMVELTTEQRKQVISLIDELLAKKK